MKLLYILAALMFIGLLMLTVSSYKVLSAAKEAQQYQPQTKGGPVTQQPLPRSPEMLQYTMMSYLGLTLFIVGGVGAIFFAFKAMSHRF